MKLYGEEATSKSLIEEIDGLLNCFVFFNRKNADAKASRKKNYINLRKSLNVHIIISLLNLNSGAEHISTCLDSFKIAAF